MQRSLPNFSSPPIWRRVLSSSFFFNDPATPEIYTLSLHDALPISCGLGGRPIRSSDRRRSRASLAASGEDRKSTRLNSSHVSISYAVFCLKKKKEEQLARVEF